MPCGECDFVKKAENIAATGVGMLVVSSYDYSSTRMGCYPPVRGRKVTVSTIMISSNACEELVSQFYSGVVTSRIRVLNKVRCAETKCSIVPMANSILNFTIVWVDILQRREDYNSTKVNKELLLKMHQSWDGGRIIARMLN